MIMSLQCALSLLLALMFQQTAPVSEITSDHFKIKFDKQLSVPLVQEVQASLESTYTNYKAKLGGGFRGKATVRIYTNLQRFKSEVQNLIFIDGMYANKTIMLNYEELSKDYNNKTKTLNRVVAQSILDDVPACPNWFAAAYGLYVANDLHHFANFFSKRALTFEDIDEDFNRAQSKQELSAAYAYAGETMVFFISKFGEHKIHRFIAELRRGVYISSAISTAFGTDVGQIEQAWQKYLPSERKEQ